MKLKKGIYLAAILVTGAMILWLLGSLILTPIQRSAAQKSIVGHWYMEAFGGLGQKTAEFKEDGTVHLFQAATAANGTYVSQDSSSFGTMTYEVTSGDTLVLTVSAMGSKTTQQVEFSIQGDTLTLGEDVYTRVK